jgi:hypothetical protein
MVAMMGDTERRIGDTQRRTAIRMAGSATRLYTAQQCADLSSVRGHKRRTDDKPAQGRKDTPTGGVRWGKGRTGNASKAGEGQQRKKARNQ